MNYLVTYYSYSGNTDKVAQVLAKMLKAKGDVTIQRLKPKAEIKTFFGQCKAAFTRKRAVLEDHIIFNTSKYDFILLGSPVWAFAPTPAMNTYLDNVSGLNGKKALIFLTSGSGAGVKKCFDNIRTVLKNKGVSETYEVNIQQRKVNDEDFIINACRGLL